MITTPICNHCGKKWPSVKGGLERISKEIVEEIRRHIETCEKNPLVKQIADQQKLIEALVGACNRAFPMLKSLDDKHDGTREANVVFNTIREALAAYEAYKKEQNNEMP
jgi:hypothetical protein